MKEAVVVRSVKEGRMKSILPMIAKKARATFKQLPSSERLGLSVEDLIQEGKILAFSKAARLWNPRKHVKFTTYLFAALDNYYSTRLRDAYAEKRTGHVYSADTTYGMTPSGSSVLLIDHLRRRSRVEKLEDKLVARIDAERAFVRTYRMASASLRMYMIRWILQPKQSKLKDGVASRTAASELRRISRLDLALCDHIQDDYVARLSIAKTLFDTFKTRRPNWPASLPLTFYGTVERDLLPLLHPSIGRSIAAFTKVSAEKIS